MPPAPNMSFALSGRPDLASAIVFSLDVGLGAPDETSIPESEEGEFAMVEVVLVVLETETADLGGVIAVAKCKFEGSKRQTNSRKRDLVAIDRRANMKESRVMAVTKMR